MIKRKLQLEDFCVSVDEADESPWLESFYAQKMKLDDELYSRLQDDKLAPTADFVRIAQQQKGHR